MGGDVEEEDEQLYLLTNPEDLVVSSSYKGPRLHFPLTMNQVEQLIDAFKKKQVNHPYLMLSERYRMLTLFKYEHLEQFWWRHTII